MVDYDDNKDEDGEVLAFAVSPCPVASFSFKD